MSRPGPDLPGVLPFGPAFIVVAGTRWRAGEDFAGLLVDLEFRDGRSAGALCFTRRGRGVTLDTRHPWGAETHERLRAYMFECGVDAIVAQDAMDDLFDTLRELLADVQVPDDLEH